MTTDKISLTFEEDLLRLLRSRVGARGISKFVGAAVRAELESEMRAEELDRYIAMLNEVNPPSDLDRLHAREAVDAAMKRLGR